MSRYEALREPMAARKQKLSDSLRLQQLFRDVEDEETWIREKEPIAASTNRGGNLGLHAKCDVQFVAGSHAMCFQAKT